MKAFIFALAVACVAAVPYGDVDLAESQRIVDGIIENWISRAQLRLSPFDPIVNNEYAGGWHLPGGENILKVRGSVEGVNAAGFSTFELDSISYNLFTGQLHLSLSLNSVSASIDAAEGEVQIFDRKLTADASGGIAVSNVRVRAGAIVAVGVDGYSVRNVELELSIGEINSEIQLNLFGREVGGRISDFLNKLPYNLEKYQSQVSRVLEYVSEYIINRLLSRPSDAQ